MSKAIYLTIIMRYMKKVLVILSLLQVGCQTNKISENKGLSKLIVKKVLQSDSTFSFQDISPKQWDRLCIIGPYVSDDRINLLNKSLKNLKSVDFEQMKYIDWNNMILFIKEEMIIDYCLIPRYPCCDFSINTQREKSLFFERSIQFKINKKKISKDTIAYVLVYSIR